MCKISIIHAVSASAILAWRLGTTLKTEMANKEDGVWASTDATVSRSPMYSSHHQAGGHISYQIDERGGGCRFVDPNGEWMDQRQLLQIQALLLNLLQRLR